MTPARKFTFPSSARLKHRRYFDYLFSKGKRAFHHPIMALWSEIPLPEGVRVQAGFAVPKKHFKKAVDRNRIKRLLREAYRLHRLEFEEAIASSGKQVAVLFITVKTDNISLEVAQQKIILLLREIRHKAEHAQ